jgi:predicted lactoylglutathione lyase
VAERSVPILPSRDLRETLAFYERLGFYADPAVDPLTTTAGFYVYVYVDDADALYTE